MRPEGPLCYPVDMPDMHDLQPHLVAFLDPDAPAGSDVDDDFRPPLPLLLEALPARAQALAESLSSSFGDLPMLTLGLCHDQPEGYELTVLPQTNPDPHVYYKQARSFLEERGCFATVLLYSAERHPLPTNRDQYKGDVVRVIVERPVEGSSFGSQALVWSLPEGSQMQCEWFYAPVVNGKLGRWVAETPVSEAVGLLYPGQSAGQMVN